MAWIRWCAGFAIDRNPGLILAVNMIALLGGSFDPVHLGHLEVANDVRRRLGAEDFRMLPAGRPPHRECTYASPAHRLEMLRLALREYPALAIDRREIDRPGPSWMVDTLAGLRHEHPDSSLCLVIGQDAANQLDSWREWRRLCALAHLVIMTRADQATQYSVKLAQELEPRLVNDPSELSRRAAGLVWPVQVRAIDISSTSVRERIAAGLPLDGWLPPAVQAYIAQHGLYGARTSL